MRYILVDGEIAITVAGTDSAARQDDERNNQVMFQNCAQFCKRISNNMQVDNVKDLDAVIPM